MVYLNNAALIKRKLLTRVAELTLKGELEEKINKIPYEIAPKTDEPRRCCIYKDRAVSKYKTMAILGIGVEEETEEFTALSTYAQMALEREKLSESHLTVVDLACSSCLKKNYTVTNLCQGCVARACIMNCPRKAISMKDGKAVIDPALCVNCGICQKACPFHAITYMPVPCEEACPVGAIKKDERGIETIDETKCIHCGKCMTACPFGAIMERSQVVDVAKKIRGAKKVSALVAPAVAGQFQAPFANIRSALLKLGFDSVYEVSEGADITIEHEGNELKEMIEKGEFMTSSCCPAYVSAVKKHVPDLLAHVSETGSPMHYIGEIARKESEVTVFIGPCTAKRYEASEDEFIDHVLTSEELAALFVGAGINVSKEEPVTSDRSVTCAARSFPVSGGVTEAVKEFLGEDVSTLLIDGVEKKSLNLLRAMAKNGSKASFIEVMACEGGCVNGPGNISKPKVAMKLIEDYKKNG